MVVVFVVCCVMFVVCVVGVVLLLLLLLLVVQARTGSPLTNWLPPPTPTPPTPHGNLPIFFLPNNLPARAPGASMAARPTWMGRVVANML